MTQLQPSGLPDLPVAPDPIPDYLDRVSPEYKTAEKLAELTRTGFVPGFPDSYRISDRGNPLLRAPVSDVMRGCWRRVLTRRISDVFCPGPYHQNPSYDVPRGTRIVRVTVHGRHEDRPWLGRPYHVQLTEAFYAACGYPDNLRCFKQAALRVRPDLGIAVISCFAHGGYLAVAALDEGEAWIAANTDLATAAAL